MLMIVFGAGASYDSAIEVPTPGGSLGVGFRPPLANQLFENRATFLPIRHQFRQLDPIIADIVGRGERSVEQVLEGLQGQAEHYPTRYSQLAAVRFYLQVLISRIVETWYDPAGSGLNEPTTGAHRATAHVSLIDQIRQSRQPAPVCLVTFNYDSLIERAVGHFGQAFKNFADYTDSQHFKLFKLHGSVTWARKLTGATGAPTGEAWGAAQYLIDNAAKITPTDEYVQVGVSDAPHSFLGNVPVVPAIAIPVERKSKFECPPAHLAALQELLPNVTAILSIGWQAKEEHFLSLLREHVPGGVIVAACSDSSQNADATLSQLTGCIPARRTFTYEHGFRNLIVRHELDAFLSLVAAEGPRPVIDE